MGKTSEIDVRDNQPRNLIINGDMRIAQRGLSIVSPVSGQYLMDRFAMSRNSGAIHTVSQDSDVPTFAQAGYLFQNSMRFNLTTSDTSIGAGESAGFFQRIEGYNFAKIAQKSFTLSFWVKATLPGTYCCYFLNTGEDRTYVAEYTILAANTWEKKTIYVSASPSAGTWNYINGIGITIGWSFAVGTSLQTTAGAWQTGSFRGTANQVNGVNTGATDLKVTGAIVNEGSEALPFELFSANSFTSELQSCQRFYELGTYSGRLDIGIAAAATVGFTTGFNTNKRTSPAMSFVDSSSGDWSTTVISGGASQYGFAWQKNTGSAGTTPRSLAFSWTADAEL